MAAIARNRITWHAITEIQSCMRVSELKTVAISRVSEVLDRLTYCPIWFSMQTVEATKWRDHRNASNELNSFRAFLLGPSSDKSNEPQCFVGYCVVLISEERRLVRFLIEKVLKVFDGCLHHRMDFPLRNITGAFGWKIWLRTSWDVYQEEANFRFVN